MALGAASHAATDLGGKTQENAGHEVAVHTQDELPLENGLEVEQKLEEAEEAVQEVLVEKREAGTLAANFRVVALDSYKGTGRCTGLWSPHWCPTPVPPTAPAGRWGSGQPPSWPWPRR